MIPENYIISVILISAVREEKLINNSKGENGLVHLRRSSLLAFKNKFQVKYK